MERVGSFGKKPTNQPNNIVKLLANLVITKEEGSWSLFPIRVCFVSNKRLSTYKHLLDSPKGASHIKNRSNRWEGCHNLARALGPRPIKPKKFSNYSNLGEKGCSGRVLGKGWIFREKCWSRGSKLNWEEWSSSRWLLQREQPQRPSGRRRKVHYISSSISSPWSSSF